MKAFNSNNSGGQHPKNNQVAVYNKNDSENSRKLFVENVEHKATDDELKGYFGSQGIVENVTKLKPGVYIVLFKDINSANNALKELNGKQFKGRNLRVQRCRPRVPSYDLKSVNAINPHLLPHQSRSHPVFDQQQGVQVFLNIGNLGNVQQKTKTLIVVILDESGSMSSQKIDVINGYNDFLNQQKGVIEDEARLSLIKFSNDSSIIHGAIPLGSVSQLQSFNYNPSGGTALYDAMAYGIDLADKNVQQGERVLCLIITDGEECTSRKYNKIQIKEMVTRRKGQGNWTFAYIGVNPGNLAQELGLDQNNVVGYNQSNPKSNFITASIALTNFRNSGGQNSQLFFNLSTNN